MRTFVLTFAVLGLSGILHAQPARDFSGQWRLNPVRSDIRATWAVPDQYLRVGVTPTAFTVSASLRDNSPASQLIYPLNGTSQKSTVVDAVLSIKTKWEGNALLVNTIVTGVTDYWAEERWELSADERLTITRTIHRKDGESESTLVYENPATLSSSMPPSAPSAQPMQPAASSRPAPAPLALVRPQAPQPQEYVVPAGTRILLRMTNAVNTKRSAPGDQVYLQTAMPVFVERRLVIPQGSYVVGSIIESERAGHAKGKSSLNFRFDTLTLPNGTSRDFRSRAGSVDTQGSLDRKEGRITGDSRTGQNVGTIAGTSAAGTGIGAIAGAASGNLGMGAGIGAAAGAAAGLARVLGSRGPDVVIPQGTTMELVLDRELRFTPDELERPNAIR